MTDQDKKKVDKKTDAVAAKSSVPKNAPLGADLLGSDVAVGGIEATDVFALGGDFDPQTSSVDTQLTRVAAMNNLGDEAISGTHDSKTQVTCTYKYTAEAGDILLTELHIGKVSGGYHMDNIQVTYANNDWPTITITGHNHTTAAHVDTEMVEYACSLTLPAGFGCTDLFVNGEATSSCVSATYTLAAEHTDVLDIDGEHLAGDNHGGTENVTAQYYGTPSLTTTGWDVTSSNASDSNSDFDQVAVNATKGLARS